MMLTGRENWSVLFHPKIAAISNEDNTLSKALGSDVADLIYRVKEFFTVTSSSHISSSYFQDT